MYCASKVRSAVATKLSHSNPTATLSKKRIWPIPPDGRCFWYSWIACVVPDEWWSISRTNLGYAKVRERQQIEESQGEALMQEVLNKILSVRPSGKVAELCEEVKDRAV